MQALRKTQAQVFGTLFQLANRWQAAGDRYLAADGLTTKQWFLIVAIDQFSPKLPTLSEAADVAGTSRQNVKQLALKLQKRGFLDIEISPHDSRASRLRITDACRAFWEDRQQEDNAFIANLLGGVSPEDLQTVARSLQTLLQAADQKGLYHA